jgi:trimeric autotransporter adhesin
VARVQRGLLRTCYVVPRRRLSPSLPQISLVFLRAHTAMLPSTLASHLRRQGTAAAAAVGAALPALAPIRALATAASAARAEIATPPSTSSASSSAASASTPASGARPADAWKRKPFTRPAEGQWLLSTVSPAQADRDLAYLISCATTAPPKIGALERVLLAVIREGAEKRGAPAAAGTASAPATPADAAAAAAAPAAAASAVRPSISTALRALRRAKAAGLTPSQTTPDLAASMALNAAECALLVDELFAVVPPVEGAKRGAGAGDGSAGAWLRMSTGAAAALFRAAAADGPAGAAALARAHQAAREHHVPAVGAYGATGVSAAVRVGDVKLAARIAREAVEADRERAAAAATAAGGKTTAAVEGISRSAASAVERLLLLLSLPPVADAGAGAGATAAAPAAPAGQQLTDALSAKLLAAGLKAVKLPELEVLAEVCKGATEAYAKQGAAAAAAAGGSRPPTASSKKQTPRDVSTFLANLAAFALPTLQEAVAAQVAARKENKGKPKAEPAPAAAAEPAAAAPAAKA